jgi:hypothetical protein
LKDQILKDQKNLERSKKALCARIFSARSAVREMPIPPFPRQSDKARLSRAKW